MKKSAFISFIVLSFIVVIRSAYSQKSFTLHTFGKVVPQATFLNPSFIPKGKVHVGLPILSSNEVTISNSFNYSNVVKKVPGDSLMIDLDQFLENLDDVNKTSVQTQTSMLFVGVRTKVGYFAITGQVLNDFKLSIPKTFMELLIKGNAHPDLIGSQLRFDDLEFKAVSYSKIGLSYARGLLDNRLHIGGKVSFLKGFFNAELQNGVDGYFQTDPQSYKLTLDVQKFRINTAGMNIPDSIGVPDGVFNLNNKGFAFDFGANWDINDNSNIQFSVLNLGQINWDFDVNNYSLENTKIEYEGIDIEDIENAEAIADSLADQFNFVESKDVYRTNLDASFYMGYNYTIADKHTFSALYNAVLFRNQYRHGIGAAYNFTAKRIFSGTLSYTYLAQQPVNIGAGISLHFGFLNLYMVSDSLYYLFKPELTRFSDFRFGLNLVFGGKAKSEAD